MFEKYNDYIRYFVSKLAYFMRVANTFMEDVIPAYLDVDSWITEKRETIANELREFLKGGDFESRILNILPVICTSRRYEEFVIYVFDKDVCYTFMRYNPKLDEVCVYGTCVWLGEEPIAEYMFVSDTETRVYAGFPAFPELNIFITSLHTEKELRDYIWQLFKKAGIYELFEGIHDTFKPCYGITNNAKNLFNEKLDVELMTIDTRDFLGYVTDSMHKAKLHDFGSIIGPDFTFELLEMYYMTKGGYLYVKLVDGSERYTFVSSYHLGYKFKPIDLVKLLDLAISALVYYSIIISKVHENYRGKVT